jgi:hypothetical protein
MPSGNPHIFLHRKPILGNLNLWNDQSIHFRTNRLRQTGGAYFEVGKKETLDQIYGKIEEELRSQYSLGCTPDANALNGYRRIKITVQRKDRVVRGRG